MNRDEIKQFAIQTFNTLPKPPDGVQYVLIAVDTQSGAYQPAVANMDVTYLVGLLHRCIMSIERAVQSATLITAEDIKVN